MGELTFNEENKYKRLPVFHDRRRSTLVKSLVSMGFGDKVAAQSLIITSVIFILISSFVLYNLITSRFEPIKVPEINKSIIIKNT